jgi:hypothetical protein
MPDNRISASISQADRQAVLDAINPHPPETSLPHRPDARRAPPANRARSGFRQAPKPRGGLI